MTSLTLKSIPPTLFEQIKAAAVASHRSLNKEIIARLEKSLMNPTPIKKHSDNWDAARVGEQADAWENLDGEWTLGASLEDEIAALYAARTPGREVPAL
jgi:hypothetical protein